ncbi:outer membrane protein [Helicobacter sp. MIT 05-5293]|uniref:outer membrane protein n=1 Tax=Helicobacter sp. MIT 05-5293 TaxID=1548149 RepID=UPI00051CC413|nr:outer membrane protein [Helicobacter sp. MIT 05-5293]TLD80107.1 outer membrane protein [Helicobacter sp. MIT 05-5293]
MKTKKLLISAALSLTLASSVLSAEESGVFVGVGIGYGGSSFKMTSDEGKQTTKLDGLSYEIIAGYKSFFTPNFGLRYYANFAYGEHKKGGADKITANAMDYGVNIDALYNFISSENVNFGAFLGLGAGAVSWGGKTLKDQKMDKTGFNLALNVGLRSEFAKHHGVEIAAKVPFMTTTLKDETGFKMTSKANYNVGVRYIFNF